MAATITTTANRNHDKNNNKKPSNLAPIGAANKFGLAIGRRDHGTGQEAVLTNEPAAERKFTFGFH